MYRLFVVLFIVGLVSVQAQRNPTLRERAKQAKKDLAAASEEYKQSLEKLLAFQQADVVSASGLLEKRRQQFKEGVLGIREVEQAEHFVGAAKEKVKETQKQLFEADLLISGAVSNDLPPVKSPYTKRTISKVLELNALPLVKVKTAIETRGVNFHLTPEDVAEFSALGATRELLKTIASNYRSFWHSFE